MLDSFPYHQSILHSATPEYEELPGFDEDIGECREEADLPRAARDYLGFIADFVGVPIRLVGVGPDRDQVDLARPPERPARSAHGGAPDGWARSMQKPASALQSRTWLPANARPS